MLGNYSFFILLTTCAVAFIIIAVKYYKQIQRYTALKFQKYKLEAKCQEQKNRFETIFNHTNNGIALLDAHGKIFRSNKAFRDLLGFTEPELQTVNLYETIYQDKKDILPQQIQCLIDRKRKYYQSEQEYTRADGEKMWVLARLSLIRDKLNHPLYYIMQLQNISLQKQAEKRLRQMAYHDPLTGLANRNGLELFIHQTLTSKRLRDKNFALICLDLDRFKNVNDMFGHDAGDLLLKIVAERLKSSVRDSDIVARLGGDEFVLLVTDVSKSETVAVIAQKILDNTLKVFTIKHKDVYITTSIGISMYPHDGENLQVLMKNADLALYRAKEHGRNNYQFYTHEMTAHVRVKLALQNALSHALAKNEFSLNYQPKLNLQTQRLCGMEVLLRWKNKEFGLITPSEIISLAEETGLIIPVSEWVFLTACKQLKAWNTVGKNLSIALNCSGIQFKQAAFVDQIQQIVSYIDIDPGKLELEITEKIIMEDPEKMLEIFLNLKKIGVKIVIDNFGTGYWSLNNLRLLAVDKVKIDKSFIRNLMVDETSAAITSTIIAMVDKLGIRSIAEGVETQEQYHFLRREGCNEIQGYYLSKPLSADEMTQFVSDYETEIKS